MFIYKNNNIKINQESLLMNNIYNFITFTKNYVLYVTLVKVFFIY